MRLGRLKVGGTLCVQSDTGVGVPVVWKRERKTLTFGLKFSDLGINTDG